MKAEIHPEYHIRFFYGFRDDRTAPIPDASTGARPGDKNERSDIDSKSHPAWIGGQPSRCSIVFAGQRVPLPRKKFSGFLKKE